jgi:uncharacterized protein (DUF1501 family)
MLTIALQRRHCDCDGVNRRDVLQLGTLGATGWALPQLLAARAAAAQPSAHQDSAVVWLWLGGGPTHIETFDPKLTAPSEYRSVTGEVATTMPGVTLGGHFGRLARQFDKLTIVRSFAHNNSGHAGGTHFVMTGYDNRSIDNGGLPTRPAVGAIVAKVRGASHGTTGIPTYSRLGRIGSDGPAFLGPAYAPFDPSGETRKNMALDTPLERVTDRRQLLAGLDRFRRDTDDTGVMAGLDAFEAQAFQLIVGSARDAFDPQQEDGPTRQRYGSDPLAQQLLIARRLVEAGCSFVTINYGGWDMHGSIKRSLDQRAPALDAGVAAFLEDVWDRGLQKKILLIITGEFGRTPRLNGGGGRDHWAPLSALALAGGRFSMGQVIGQSSAKAETPLTQLVRPQDLMATVFHHLDIDPHQQFVNQAGRPVYMIEDGRPIPELL